MTQNSQDRVNIHAAICRVMKAVGAVGKTRKNVAQNYSYRGVADIVKACQHVMAENGVHCSPEEVTETRTERDTRSGGKAMHVCLKVRFRFFAEDGSYTDCVVVGEAADSGDKASAKAHSIALKYALSTVFMIPEENDPDVDIEASSPEFVVPPPPKSLPIVPAKAKEVAPQLPK